jgi:hypothetical protein
MERKGGVAGHGAKLQNLPVLYPFVVHVEISLIIQCY